MKVKDLIAALQAENPDAEVILQRDSEGNGYSPIHSMDSGHWKDLSEWYGEPVDENEGGKPAVFFVPCR